MKSFNNVAFFDRIINQKRAWIEEEIIRSPRPMTQQDVINLGKLKAEWEGLWLFLLHEQVYLAPIPEEVDEGWLKDKLDPYLIQGLHEKIVEFGERLEKGLISITQTV